MAFVLRLIGHVFSAEPTYIVYADSSNLIAGPIVEALTFDTPRHARAYARSAHIANDVVVEEY